MPSRTASCHCGQLRIEVEGEPRFVGICHCLACQQRTGSVFAALASFSAPYRVFGNVTEYVRAGDQGANFRFRFCPVCGTTVFHTEEGEVGSVGVAVGAFADPNFPAPRYSIYDCRRHPWVQLPPGTTVFERDPSWTMRSVTLRKGPVPEVAVVLRLLHDDEWYFVRRDARVAWYVTQLTDMTWMVHPAFSIHQIAPGEVLLMEALLTTFGEAFGEVETYGGNRPGARYLRRLLGSDYFIALGALKGGKVVGGIAAYELKKFEQERSEIYIYDLAVAAGHRREGIASALIQELRKIAEGRGAYVIFVQADIRDEPAIALYTKLGAREEVLHFDIAVKGDNEGA